MEKQLEPDALLLARAMENEPDATGQVFAIFSPLVRTIAASYFLMGGDEEDLYQEGLIGLMQALRSFDAQKCDSFVKYAKICIHRSILSAIRFAARKKHEPLNSSVEIPDETPLSTGDPEETVLLREKMISLYSLIDVKLSEKEKSVLDLYIEGLSHKEIAARLSITPKAVENALTRIRNKFI